MADPEPRLPAPYTSADEEDAWEAAIGTFVTHLVIYNLAPDTTPAQLFAPFAAPEHPPLLFYHACAHLLRATRDTSEAAQYIPLLAGLFALLKEAGLKRDDADGVGAWGNAIVFPTLRALLGDIPAPPGYTYDSVAFALVPDPDYDDDSDSLFTALAEYARAHEGLLRLWALVARLEADCLLGGEPGTMSLLFHQGPVLLHALEDPVQRGVWETLWAAVGRCDQEMAYGAWGKGSERLGPFKQAARTIAGDERAPVEWRGRFALILEELEKER
ncbi:hypothetical protein B0H19DRAFT_1261177 [Mycena capillaripes]|nr:hypothetical protein B0H19DRAFT_1261177 [Mycena capillaripes]